MLGLKVPEDLIFGRLIGLSNTGDTEFSENTYSLLQVIRLLPVKLLDFWCPFISAPTIPTLTTASFLMSPSV